MKKTPENEIFSRCTALKRCLNANEIDLCLIVQNVDRYYYTGTFQDGVLLVRRDGQPVLFIKRTLERAREESPINTVIGYENINEIYNYIRDHNFQREVIGLEMDVLPAKLYTKILSNFPDARFVDISIEIRNMRAVKSNYEISLLIEGGKRLDSIFTKLKDEIKPGISEFELSMKLSDLFLKENSVLIVRTRMFNMEVHSNEVLSGRSAYKHSFMDSPSGGGDGINAAFPSGSGHKKLKKGEPILIDAAFNHEGYIVDCTRIFAIGSIDPIFEKAHSVSKGCHEIFLEKVKEGMAIPDICKEINDFVAGKGLQDVYMGGAKFMGHGVGLELDEFPVISDRFEGRIKSGMVIAFEPKFVFESGTVGYENMYCIGRRGGKSINKTDESIQHL